jgi:hypothetical protein
MANMAEDHAERRHTWLNGIVIATTLSTLTVGWLTIQYKLHIVGVVMSVASSVVLWNARISIAKEARMQAHIDVLVRQRQERAGGYLAAINDVEPRRLRSVE